MKQATLQNEVGMAVLRKSLDLSAEQGAEIVKIMSQSSGVGQRVDLYA
jgi:hypothetical protein